MKKVVLIAVALVSLAACVKHEPLPPLTGPIPPKETIALSFPKYPNGERVDLAKEKGNVVLLDVWATWCEPCRDALPTYEALAKEYGGRGLKVYALNVDTDQSMIPAFLNETKVSLPILLDKNGEAAEQTLKVKLMPTSFLIDKKGVIRHVHEGFAEEFLQQYQSEIEELLAEKAE